MEEQEVVVNPEIIIERLKRIEFRLSAKQGEQNG
jgi:hypothetical protein